MKKIKQRWNCWWGNHTWSEWSYGSCEICGCSCDEDYWMRKHLLRFFITRRCEAFVRWKLNRKSLKENPRPAPDSSDLPF